MRTITLMLSILMVSTLTMAQLQNTRWKGTIRGDNPRNVILDFKKDSLIIYTVSDGEIVERMTYTADKGSFTVHKIEGQSDCDNSTPGKYAYVLQNGKMNINLISDACNDRSSALDTTRWTTWKDHPAVKVNGNILEQYVGVYEFDPQHHFTVTLVSGTLYIEGPANNLPKSPMTPESKTRFFLKIAGIELDFVKDTNGKVVKMISHEEQDHDLKKIK